MLQLNLLADETDLEQAREVSEDSHPDAREMARNLMELLYGDLTAEELVEAADENPTIDLSPEAEGVILGNAEQFQRLGEMFPDEAETLQGYVLGSHDDLDAARRARTILQEDDSIDNVGVAVMIRPEDAQYLEDMWLDI